MKIIFLIGFALTAILTWPFIANLSTFYKDSGDYAVFASSIHYNQQSFSSGQVFNWQRFLHGYQFYPQPNTISYGDYLIPMAVLSWLILIISQNFILSINLMLFLNFTLAFAAGFYFIHSLVKNRLPSLIGAVVLVFNPLFLTHFPDHVYGYFALILSFWAATRFLLEPGARHALWLGLSLIFVILTMAYLSVFIVLFLPVLIVPFLLFYIYRRDARNLFILFKCALVGIIFLPAIIFFIKPYLEFSKNENVTRTVGETVFFSARLLDWFSAGPDSFLYGNWVKSYEKSRAPGADFDGRFNYREHTLFLNIVPMILFGLGLVFTIRRFRKENIRVRLLMTGFFLTLLFSFVLTFGPFFMGWNGNIPTIKLPYYYLFDKLLLLRGVRALTRFQMVFYIPFALFTAYGVLALKSKFLNRKIFLIVLSVILFGIILENFSLRSFDNVSSNLGKLQDKNFQNDLRFLDRSKVLHLPIHIPELGEWSFYTLNWGVLTNSIAMNGVTGYAPPDQLRFLISLKKGLGEEELKRLAAIKVDYLIVHKDLLGKEAEIYAPNLELYQKGKVYEDGEILISDIKKYDFQLRICDFEKDLQKEIRLARGENIAGQFYALIIKNNGDCYLPSVYSDKYRQMTFTTTFLETRDHTAYYRLPVIIGPREETILSVPAGNLVAD